MSSETLSAEDVDHIAHLCRLAITPEERQLYLKELNSILDYINELRSLDTEGIEATFMVHPRFNVLRSDTPSEGLTPDDALSGAPAREGAYFRIPRILEEGS